MAIFTKIWYAITIHRKGEMIMKKKLITLILSALATVSLLALTACGNGNALTETASDVSSFEEVSSVESEATSENQSDAIAEEPIGSAEQPVEEPVDTTANDTNAGGQTNQNNGTTYAPPSNGNANTSSNSGNTQMPSAPQRPANPTIPTTPQPETPSVQHNTPAPQNHAPIYKQQWVVDKAAWTEEIPVWGNKEIAVCNTCGADISGIAAQHTKEHTLAGEGGSWRSEVIKVQTGTRTIQHEEQGHYENVLVCGGCTGTH